MDIVTATARMPLRKATRIPRVRKLSWLAGTGAARQIIDVLTETDVISFAAEIATDFHRVEAMAASGAER